METKELMVGNYVLKHTGEITKVLEVLTNSVTIKGDGYKTIKSLTIPAKSISPIILTEEHLLGFGFTEYFRDKFLKKGCFVAKEPIFKLKEDEWIINKEIIINYVHELQNYYYLHTKEHLKYDFK